MLCVVSLITDTLVFSNQLRCPNPITTPFDHAIDSRSTFTPVWETRYSPQGSNMCVCGSGTICPGAWVSWGLSKRYNEVLIPLLIFQEHTEAILQSKTAALCGQPWDVSGKGHRRESTPAAAFPKPTRLRRRKLMTFSILGWTAEKIRGNRPGDGHAKREAKKPSA